MAGPRLEQAQEDATLLAIRDMERALPRATAFGKLTALGAGAAIVRKELS